MNKSGFLRYANWESALPDNSFAIRLHQIGWYSLLKETKKEYQSKSSIHLIYVLRGDAKVTLNKGVFLFNEGCCYLSDQAFSLESNCSELVYIYLECGSTMASNLYEDIVEVNGCVIPDGQLILPIMESIYAKGSSPFSSILDIELSAMIYHLFILIHQLRSMDHSYDAVFSYIKEHYQEEITNGQLAKISCKSEYHFLREFKRIYKDTPHSYVNKYRLFKARRLLLETDLPIQTIAQKTGFKTSAQFAQSFKKINQLTPKEFRNSFK